MTTSELCGRGARSHPNGSHRASKRGRSCGATAATRLRSCTATCAASAVAKHKPSTTNPLRTGGLRQNARRRAALTKLTSSVASGASSSSPSLLWSARRSGVADFTSFTPVASSIEGNSTDGKEGFTGSSASARDCTSAGGSAGKDARTSMPSAVMPSTPPSLTTSACSGLAGAACSALVAVTPSACEAVGEGCASHSNVSGVSAKSSA